MRQTFDRVVGPVTLVRVPPPEMPESSGGDAVAQIIPTDLGRWRIIAGTRPSAQLRVDVAELRRAGDDAIARAASRLGLYAHGPAVRSDRAAALVRAVRDGVASSDPSPLRDPLVRYAPGEDPRPMWKTHVDPALFERDVSDAIADTLAWALRELRVHPRCRDWEERGAHVARTWVASDGAAGLYRVTSADTRRAPALERADWLPTFAYALLRSGTSAKDLGVAWHCLAAIAPLLVALAESYGAKRERGHADVVLFDRVDRWRALAVEAAGWVAVLDELAMLDDELSRPRDGRGKVSNAGIRAAVSSLHEALLPRRVTLYHRVHDLEAADVDGIRAALQGVVAERLAMCGVSVDTPPGGLVGIDAAVLLSVQADLVRKRCAECERPARSGYPRCTVHQRAVWRGRQARNRRSAARGTRRRRR